MRHIAPLLTCRGLAVAALGWLGFFFEPVAAQSFSRVLICQAVYTDGGWSGSVRRAVESLEKQRFIPATLGGVASPARYFEFIYFHGWPPRPRIR